MIGSSEFRYGEGRCFRESRLARPLWGNGSLWCFFFRFEQCGIQIVLIEIGMLYIAVILIENPASSQSDIVVNPAINEYAYATIW